MAKLITLANGCKMPMVGLGTWLADTNVDLEAALEAAWDAGYRHFDTAYLYGNEVKIGQVLKKWLDSGKIRRDEIFITTKLPWIGMTPELASRFLHKSLKNLQLDFVDMYLLHTPFGLQYVDDDTPFPSKDGAILFDKATDLVAVWKALEKEVDAGFVKSLGVSNFNLGQVERICKIAKHKPMNNQVELHAYHQQKELREGCKKLGVSVCAFAPIGSPGRGVLYETVGMSFQANGLLDDPNVIKIANGKGKTPGQILLRFLVQLGVIVIPKSTNKDRIKQNIEIFDFDLTQEEIKTLEALDKGDAGRTFGFEHLPGVEEHPEFPFKK